MVFLTVANEIELINLIEKAKTLGIKYSVFKEPDMDNKITAIALEPSEQSKKITSSLRLLGKELITI